MNKGDLVKVIADAAGVTNATATSTLNAVLESIRKSLKKEDKVNKMINTIKQALENSFSYADYRNKVTSLIAEGKSTGHEQSADLLHYSELNEARMHRLDKTIEVTPEVKAKLQNQIMTDKSHNEIDKLLSIWYPFTRKQ